MSALDAQPPPQECDLAILTVIDSELKQVLKAFGIAEKRGQSLGSRYYWDATVNSRDLQRPLKVVMKAHPTHLYALLYNERRFAHLSAALEQTRAKMESEGELPLWQYWQGMCLRKDLPRNVAEESPTT